MQSKSIGTAEGSSGTSNPIILLTMIQTRFHRIKSSIPPRRSPHNSPGHKPPPPACDKSGSSGFQSWPVSPNSHGVYDLE
jgi:hypothetical protein